MPHCWHCLGVQHQRLPPYLGRVMLVEILYGYVLEKGHCFGPGWFCRWQDHERREAVDDSGVIVKTVTAL